MRFKRGDLIYYEKMLIYKQAEILCKPIKSQAHPGKQA